MNKAIFFDRDGTLNKMDMGHAPFYPEELELYNYTIDCLKKLKNYHLFLITNQPDAIKGKTNIENLNNVHNKFDKILKKNDIYFMEYYYCWHEKKCLCTCMKPNSCFPELARSMYNLDFKQCWFVGDQDSDILCGQKYGMKTILLNNPNSSHKRGKSKPDYFVEDLKEATEVIIND
jgi:D-glycero-D-manno-heptose 1,7-bisphosphate phosphatase